MTAVAEILRTLYSWFCTCGQSGYPQSDADSAETFGRLHETDCPTGSVDVRVVEPL